METSLAVDPDWAWAPYRPDAARPWTLARAAHLHRRAGFGANWRQLQQALDLGPQRTVDELVTSPTDAEAFNQTYDAYDRSVGRAESAETLRAWWLRRMLLTPFPLLEKMTLFWHGHFAVSNLNVKDAFLMHRYVHTLRSQALGDFATLLGDICRDPAVLMGAGALENRKSRPNLTFARVLVDHFTLGPDRATQHEILQVARALTGTFVRRGRVQFVAREHDDGPQSLFGRQGAFQPSDVVGILLDQRATADRIVRKLYRQFISETHTPEASLVAPLVSAFAADHHIGGLVETLLRSNLFHADETRSQCVKSPVDYALGIIRALEGMVSTTHLAQDLAEQGQNLYHPPTIKGWQGGRVWINSDTLIRRANLAYALLRKKGPYQGRLDVKRILEKYGRAAPDQAPRFLRDLLLQSDPGIDTDASFETVLHGIVTCPEFQLA